MKTLPLAIAAVKPGRAVLTTALLAAIHRYARGDLLGDACWRYRARSRPRRRDFRDPTLLHDCPSNSLLARNCGYSGQRL